LPRVILGVCGGIAAYKSVELLRLLVRAGHEVSVVPTSNALRFVGEPTFEALSGKPINTSLWDGGGNVTHVAKGIGADLVVIAPATADFMARATHGIASDLLSNILLTATCPMVLAPAMHTQMWEHPATRANVESLRSRGYIVLEPDTGPLTGTDTGKGRLPAPQEIFDALEAQLNANTGALAARHIVISAGGTREDWDPVRYIGNRSSGKQGVALARAALAAGARVTLVVGHMDIDPPAGAEVVQAKSSADMHKALIDLMGGRPDGVIMAAAVADFRPAHQSAAKIKKVHGVQNLELEPTADILTDICRQRVLGTMPIIIGFAAETSSNREDLIALGSGKLVAKGADAVVVNNVSNGEIFGSENTEVLFIEQDQVVEPIIGSKLNVSHAVVHRLAQLLNQVDSRSCKSQI
jgi:phosphopantothenoylcysteine decarboxylase/phosphopantothenate--cysteine ligase